MSINPKQYKESVQPKFLHSEIIHQKKQLIFKVEQTVDKVFPNQDYKYYIYIKNISGVPIHNIHIKVNHPHTILFNEEYKEDYISIDKLENDEVKFIYLKANCQATGKHYVHFICYGDGTGLFYKTLVLNCAYTHTSDEIIHRLHIYDFTPYEDTYMMNIKNFSQDVTQLFKTQKLPFKAGEQPFAMQVNDSELNKEPFSNVEHNSFLYQNDILKNTREHVYQYISRENFNENSVESYEGKNLRDLIDQINQYSTLFKAKFLNTGTNKLKTDFRQYEPDGFIHRFGLLNSEIYHYLGTLPTYSYMSDYLFRWAPDGKEPLNLYPQKIAMKWGDKQWSGRGWIVYRIATPEFIASNDFHEVTDDNPFGDKRWERVGHFYDKQSAESYMERQRMHDNIVEAQLKLSYKKYIYELRESYYDTGVFYVHIPINKIPSNFYLLDTKEIESLIQRAKPFGTKALIRYLVENTFDNEMEFLHYPIYKLFTELDCSDTDFISYFIQSQKYKLIKETKCGKTVQHYGLKPHGLTSLFEYPFEQDMSIESEKFNPVICKADMKKELIAKNTARCKNNKTCIEKVKNRPYPDNSFNQTIDESIAINQVAIDNNLSHLKGVANLLYQNNFDKMAFYTHIGGFKQYKPNAQDRIDSEQSPVQRLFLQTKNNNGTVDFEEKYKVFSLKIDKYDDTHDHFYKISNQQRKANTFKIPITGRKGIDKENGKIGIGFIDGLNNYHLFSMIYNDIYHQDYLEYGTMYNNNFKLKEDGFGNVSALCVKFMNIEGDINNTIAIFFIEQDGEMHYFYHIICPTPSELFIYLSDNLTYVQEYAKVSIPYNDNGVIREREALQYIDKDGNDIPGGKKTYKDEEGNLQFGTVKINNIPIDISQYIKYMDSWKDKVYFETPFFNDIEKYETNLLYGGENWTNLYRINKAENSYTYIQNKSNVVMDVNDIMLHFDNINLPEKAIIKDIRLRTILSSSHTKNIYCEASYQNNYIINDAKGKSIKLSSDNCECYPQDNKSQYYYYYQIQQTNNPEKIAYYKNLINENILFDEGIDYSNNLILQNPYWIETTQFTDIAYDCNNIKDIELVIEGFNHGSQVDLISQLLYEEASASEVSKEIENGYFYKKISLPFANSFLLDYLRLRFRFDNINDEIEIFDYYLNITFINKESYDMIEFEETDELSNRDKNIYYIDLLKPNVTSEELNNGLTVRLSFDSLSPGEQYKIYSNELEIIYKVPEIEFLINRNKFDKRVDNQFVSITGKSENACLSGEFYIDANYFSQIYSDVNADNLGIELRDSVYQAFLCPTDNITAIEIYPNGFKGNPDANLKLGIYENRGTTPGKLIKEVYASGWTKSNKDLKNLNNIKYEINVEELKPQTLYWFKIEVENPLPNNYYLLKYTTTQRGECKLLMKENNNYINMFGSLEFNIYSQDLTTGFSELPTMQDYLTDPYIKIGLHRGHGTVSNLVTKKLVKKIL